MNEITLHLGYAHDLLVVNLEWTDRNNVKHVERVHVQEADDGRRLSVAHLLELEKS